MGAAWLGLVAGSAHVFAGPDHLVALAPVVADDRRRGMRLGALWGLGHGLGVVVLGAAGQLFREAVGARDVSAWSELGVGVLLVVMGTFALWRSRSVVLHSHAHEHGATDHEHLHVHIGSEGAGLHRPRDHVFHRHGARLAFGVGVLHGTAGVGHLLGILPSLFLGPRDAALYLGAYLASAIVSMAAFGWSLGWALNRLDPGRMPWAVRTASAMCILVGAVWVVTAFPG